MIDGSALARYDEARAAFLAELSPLEQLVDRQHREVLEAAREQLERSTFVLAAVGEFSSGKSFLLNALLGTFGLLATDINPSTATITELEYAPEAEAYAYHDDGRVERVPLDRLSRFVAVASSAQDAGAVHDATKDESGAPSRVVVKIDAAFLRRGFTVADTPGLASINPAHRRATLQFLPRADAVLYLIDTQQPFSDGDASFLRTIRQHLDTIFIVQTKIDLWQQIDETGVPAWEHAYERIAKLAAVHAPGTYVYAVSARDYVEGLTQGDVARVERSRFPLFLSALDASVVRNSGRTRLRRTRERVRLAASDTIERLRNDIAMFQLASPALEALHAKAEPELNELASWVERSRSRMAPSAERVMSALGERGAILADETIRLLEQSFDAADIAQLRDRARLHILVDRAVTETVNLFADDVSTAAAADYERALRAASAHMQVRFSFSDAASRAFGASGRADLWTGEPAKALCATIVLQALSGPAIAIVQAIAERFSAAPFGTYMKRELTADLRATIFPAFRDAMQAFVHAAARSVVAIRTDYMAALDAALAQARDSRLSAIERALQAGRDGTAAQDARDMEQRAERIAAILDEIDRGIDAFLQRGQEIAAADPGEEIVRRAHVAEAFDREAYNRGLQPQRWRVSVLGGLRRGKSSLINAFAQTRVLTDEAAGQMTYPVHVRYGEQQTAYALSADGTWRELGIEAAPGEAAENPLLILTPWRLPRELVLVHAPAFDSGEATAEDVCVVAAAASNEVLCLFSRQLSDRELAFYERTAELGRPMIFVHTLADNESPAERRHVAELAQEYLRERKIPVQRLFTISTAEYAAAKRDGRPPAAWNEIEALVATIAAHAEEHMARLERLKRAAAPPAEAIASRPLPARGNGFFARFFHRR